MIRDSGGMFTNVIRTNLLDMKRLKTLDPRHISAVAHALNANDIIAKVEEEEEEKKEEDAVVEEKREGTTCIDEKHWNYMSLTTPHTKHQFELLLSLQRPPFPKNHHTIYKIRVFVGIPRSAENGKSRRSNSVQYVRVAETIPVTNTRSFPGSVLIEIEDRLLDPKFHARIRFDLIKDDQYVSRRFEAHVCSVRLMESTSLSFSLSLKCGTGTRTWRHYASVTLSQNRSSRSPCHTSSSRHVHETATSWNVSTHGTDVSRTYLHGM